ncbi:hypothetical protein I553_1010 [Mycobacterium xenopi 4042]|uniref:Uncharacterized protein n=1 Tax=Mycobacterium xenopi 4042 TaxID=1299334 RepID=X7ZBR1_MYCXE|nr:hypothetical protein I553_1010 [Mycobacterium xenopi 4042]
MGIIAASWDEHSHHAPFTAARCAPMWNVELTSHRYHRDISNTPPAAFHQLEASPGARCGLRN